MRIERVGRDERDADGVRRIETRGAVGEDRDVPTVIERLVEIGRVEEAVVATGEPLGDGQLCDVEVLQPLTCVVFDLGQSRREVELRYPCLLYTSPLLPMFRETRSRLISKMTGLN